MTSARYKEPRISEPRGPGAILDAYESWHRYDLHRGLGGLSNSKQPSHDPAAGPRVKQTPSAQGGFLGILAKAQHTEP